MGLYKKTFIVVIYVLKVSSLQSQNLAIKYGYYRGFQGCSVKSFTRRRGIQHNDTQLNDIRDNDTQYKGLICDIQHK